MVSPKKSKGGNAPAAKEYNPDRIVVDELKELYAGKLLEIERSSLFHKFHAPEMLPSEIGSKPTVLLLGQYSVGKTTFIKHLIKTEYPGIHIGPEPTTDRYIAVVHGKENKVIKGNALTGVVDLPFAGLSTFGAGFLNKFEAAVVPAPLLRDINIIDTPGVLSGEKQRVARGYNFAQVSRWFAERSDLILLLFDAHKLDISDEFKSVMEELAPHEDKVRCVLNKVDQLEPESVIRIYGALLWSMGKIFKGAEVTRVYVGSFQDDELRNAQYKAMFEKDHLALMGHLAELPKMCSMRKVNEMVKRIRLTIVHTCVLGHLRSQMPLLYGQEGVQKRLISSLAETFEQVKNTYRLSEGDFPDIEDFKGVLQRMDFYTFPKTNRVVLNQLQDMLLVDIPRIIALVAGVEDEECGTLSDSRGSKSNDDGEGSKQAHMLNVFFMEDEAEGGNGLSESTVMIGSGVAVFFLLLSMVIASVMDKHATIIGLWQAIAAFFESLLATK